MKQSYVHFLCNLLKELRNCLVLGGKMFNINTYHETQTDVLLARKKLVRQKLNMTCLLLIVMVFYCWLFTILQLINNKANFLTVKYTFYS